jgi:hypothetical protein
LFGNFGKEIDAKLEKLDEKPKEDEKPREDKKNNNPGNDDQKREYKSIKESTDLLCEVKVIRDQLNILNFLLAQQEVVWKNLLDIPSKDKPTGSIHATDERWRGPSRAMKEVDEMDKIAQRIEESVGNLPLALAIESNSARSTPFYALNRMRPISPKMNQRGSCRRRQ